MHACNYFTGTIWRLTLFMDVNRIVCCVCSMNIFSTTHILNCCCRCFIFILYSKKKTCTSFLSLFLSLSLSLVSMNNLIHLILYGVKGTLASEICLFDGTLYSWWSCQEEIKKNKFEWKIKLFVKAAIWIDVGDEEWLE